MYVDGVCAHGGAYVHTQEQGSSSQPGHWLPSTSAEAQEEEVENCSEKRLFPYLLHHPLVFIPPSLPPPVFALLCLLFFLLV